VSEGRFGFRAKPHLSDDETVAKMGHPDFCCGLDMGHPAGGMKFTAFIPTKLKVLLVAVLRSEGKNKWGRARAKGPDA